MPVRIIFRGLILFQFPDAGKDKGKLVALLVNNPAVTGGTSTPPGGGKKKHRPHEHNHNAECQVLTGRGSGTDLLPVPLKSGVDLNITVPGDTGVVKARSFLRHVPNLDNIIERGSPAVRQLTRGAPNMDLVHHVVKVNRGTVLVRDVVTWDEAGFPLSGNPLDRGERPRSHAVAKFMGSDVDGHMADEVVVVIDDASVANFDSKKDPKLKKKHEGATGPNPHVPEKTVEIVVTNYEYQRGTPVPWSFDFQWLFEVAGYGATDLGGREFDSWIPFAERYNRDLFESDRAVLLGGLDHTVGRPFPYLESFDALTPLNPLTNELERPLCSSGTTTNPFITPS